MQKNIPHHIASVILILCAFSAQAQTEHIEYLPYTPQKSLLKSATQDFAPTRLLALPFFDDFAYPQSRPAAQLWADDFAFVNTSFAKNAPTIGVLTLDALDNNGALYPQASSNVFTADHATSRPINLLNYRKVFASNMLYKNTGASFELFESDTYYLYEHSLRSFIDVVKGVPYYAGDTIYIKTITGFEPTQIAVYTEQANQKVLIPESLNNSRTWIPYKVDDNIALSFYYQAGGYANRPDAQDSLVLEFYAPFARQGIFINEITKQWVEIFNATDTVVSLAGYYMVADTLENIPIQALPSWQLPEIPCLAPTIAPYSHAIVKATDLGIDKFTSSVFYLLSPTIDVIDSVFLETIVSAENSYARLPDGSPVWSFSAIETPAQPNDTWKTVWNVSSADIPASMNDYFSTVYIPVIQSNYLQKGFRFRFKNYASLSNDASHARNEDFWHIDMVWLDANRTSAQLHIADVAFVTNISPLYNRYTALPIHHFSQLSEADFRMTIVSTFRNFDKVPRKIKFNFAVQNSQTNEAVSFPSYETDLLAYETASEYDVLSDWDVEFFDFMKTGIAGVDNANFEFKYFFTDNNNPIFEHYRWNDTSRVNLTMSNYYAYDDGTPEAGYGLRNAPMGKVAFKFDILKPDTLRAIQMYFNPTLEQIPKLFNLCIWSVGANGMPDSLLYRRTSTRVLYADGLYKFVTYPIESDAILTGETDGIYMKNSFFVGWEQPYDVLLNMGMDLSNQMRNRLYFNTAFQWEPSMINGTLMIRPQFGKKISTSISTASKKNDTVLLYPTIIQSQAYIQANEEIMRCEFVDITGKTVQQLPVINNTIDCNSVPNGFYLVKLYNGIGVVAVKKCVVRR
ncbi:MAG: T9SS type A sorting domain-containing protein [Bacteroidetes bacterium]|nr:T9SS type A sorting domain-containing protein [Bacteroidota bacterium]